MEKPNLHTDAELFRATVRTRPWFAAHTLFHHLFFWIWILLGIVVICLTLYEMKTASLKFRIAHDVSAEIGRDFHVPPLLIEDKIVPYVERVSELAVLCGVFIFPFFFLLAFYCRRLISKSNYIRRLEEIAKSVEKQQNPI